MLPTLHQVRCGISVSYVFPQFKIPSIRKGPQFKLVVLAGREEIFPDNFKSPCEQKGRKGSCRRLTRKGESLASNLLELGKKKNKQDCQYLQLEFCFVDFYFRLPVLFHPMIPGVV